MTKRNPTAEMPFFDHLEELRWRILKSVSALLIGCVLGFLLVRRFEVTALLVKPVQPYLAALGPSGDIATAGKLLAIHPGTPFVLDLRLSLILGVLFTFPVIAYQAWAFLAPALRPNERRVIVPSLYLGLLLFSVGVFAAYTMALPLTLKFFYGFEPDYLYYSLEANAYLSFVVRMLIAFGLLFELPIVLMLLSSAGLVSPAFLRAKRRHAIVALAVLAAFITPMDWPIMSLVMVVPLALLYEIGILLSHFASPQKQEPPATTGFEPPMNSVEWAQ